MAIDSEALTRDFLLAYEKKDIEAIAKMFHPEVVLRDWNSEVTGLANAISEYGKNFEQAESLQITVKKIHVAEQSAAAELGILVNLTEQLNVVDVLSFSEDGKILSIVAYRGL